jgi:hypothetical protein
MHNKKMNKYILPLLIGAGAIFYFSRKNKEDNKKETINKFDETKEAVLITTPKKSIPRKSSISSKLKSFDVNKAISNVSKLKNSKGFAVAKKIAQKKFKKKSM